MNLERGIRKSLKYAAFGFTIPIVVIGLIAFYHFTFHDIHPIDRSNDLARLPAMMLVPSIGLAILFGLAAFGSFTPNYGISFIRSFIVISAATMIAVFATRPRIPRKTVDPNAWVETAIPLAVALIATIAILICNTLTPSQKDGDELKPKLKPNHEITNG
jgi:cytochrome bd-type quinol oxidase subunit 2